MLLCAWDILSGGSTEIVFTESVTTDALMQRAFAHIGATYNPRAVYVHRPADDLGALRLETAGYPFAAAPASSVLVCTDAACKTPITTSDELTAAFPGNP